MQRQWKEFTAHTHIVQAVTLSWQCHPASIFRGMLVVITFSSNKHIRLNDTHMRGLEGNTAVAERGKPQTPSAASYVGLLLIVAI
jgi:hypothetical protein